MFPSQTILSHGLDEADGTGAYAYRARSGLLVAALASNLEGNVVGGVALDLDGGGGEVVEVLVEQLEGQTRKLAKMPHTAMTAARIGAFPASSDRVEAGERSQWGE